ncbi:5-dehydro-4-deoxy-D-glucuronate isomerase [Pelagibacterium halotolerans]|uniref:4-deoxy-L-threo-5-hexosulose-uronate ketol-isomerase n=1 Tax=Pelagibacterium halotolerans (strain DSM 22347 / JCM 15775 / CGMCC 1.7692 / B2) TaxID=1082931 RepID=G4RFM8_PELHB|nr:5-dehydro-4-deoxy-D-glucuronate isomerase [Pelagibacterium halotolerans]AEQ53030.1 4-deoxy-L-threo-5-hexosulose-uronate ketol-isomerase [Pelagibacterium halotolerans B2]QJR17314.1 5-dehydro-4-deoxy-D-glucuronate isomerase [Pelagibacterium halotolerans]SEA86388.1 4-deoxy-L-threo-5-hexosulose-uronate ketol-isomerase [Pelagibacterium halotolerans]
MSRTRFTSRDAIAPAHAAGMDTTALRENFLIDDLFSPGVVSLTYTHYDRMIVGGAVPGAEPLPLDPIKPTGTENFLDRREMIAVNIGGEGKVTVGDESFTLGTRDMIYVGRGASVSFASADPANPAKFYLVSAPAHATHPTAHIRIGDAKRLDLGSSETCNERSIFQFTNAVETCQLVVGMTTLAPGSIWNTMPAHIHSRRMEAYLYFDMDEDQRVIHLMGEPKQTRHLIVANQQAILSPPWSIHSGAGTASYTFIWAMAGDNVDYTDVEPIQPGDIL